MLLIRALFILLSERGFRRKWPDMFSVQLGHLINVLKSLSVPICLHQKPHIKMTWCKILDRWPKKKESICSLQFNFCYESNFGKTSKKKTGFYALIPFTLCILTLITKVPVLKRVPILKLPGLGRDCKQSYALCHSWQCMQCRSVEVKNIHSSSPNSSFPVSLHLSSTKHKDSTHTVSVS